MKKRWEKSSGSTSGDKSAGRRQETTETGIVLKYRELVPLGKTPETPFIWFFIALGQLLLVLEGFAVAMVTGLNLTVHSVWLYVGILLIGIVATLFFFGERLTGYRPFVMMAGIVVYSVVLFLTQNSFIDGMYQLLNGVFRCINKEYDSNIPYLSAGSGTQNLTMFLLEVFVLFAFVLAVFIVYRADVLWITVLLFPLLTILVLVGAKPLALSLFFLLFGILSIAASSRMVRKKRLWGKKGSSGFMKNLARYENIQKKTALIICTLGILLAVPGFYMVRPILDVQLAKAERITAKAEGTFIETVLNLLPQISAGKWNLKVETSGGGVTDGVLRDVEGYNLQGVEDLKLTSDVMPEETIYLKGYVGAGYLSDRWVSPSEETFDNAAMNWKAEDNKRLYIQNLSFLRMLNAEKDGGNEGVGIHQLTVERIHADGKYTYFPYHAYLNEYYEVQGGDGYVSGQSEQDDIFSYYTRKEYSALIQAWNEDEDKKSVLDRVEASYAAYAKEHYLEVPLGFEALQKQCEDTKIKSEDTDKVEAYIRTFLSNGYTYDMDAPQPPEGEDFIKYFLYESKSGYSVQYASAATLMFRMFGIPARYVVGYAAPKNLFRGQPDGTYEAVLQDDNAHAWVEIYVEGQGFMPVEMTPGALGTAEEVEFIGDAVTSQDAPEEDSKDSEEDKQDEEKKYNPWKEWFNGNLESVIHVIMAVIIVSFVCVSVITCIRRRRRNLGLNRKRAPEERITDIFKAYYRQLVKHGMSPETESYSEAFALEVQKQNPTLPQEEFEKMMALVEESCYGFRERQEQEVLYMRQRYKSLKRDIRYRFFRKKKG